MGRFDNDDKFIFLLEACKEIGLKEIDPNSRSQLGVFKTQFTCVNGMRQSTNGAFIRPIRGKRSNLVIKTNAYVMKVIINQESKKAVGIEYFSFKKNASKKAFANKEVLVSAGSINSAKLLKLSGIGPSEELQMLHINVLSNLSVGFNLQDHIFHNALNIKLSKKFVVNKNYSEIENDAIYWLITRRGSLSNLGPVSIGAFIKTSYEESNSQAPDLQYIFYPYVYENILNLPESPSMIAARPIDNHDTISILPVLLNPRSRGTIKLNKTNPIWGSPLIQPNYFDKDEDLNIIIEGTLFAKKLFNTKAFKKMNLTIAENYLHACKDYKFDSKEYWECSAKTNTQTLFHPIGTCKMGPINDTEAVVDRRLRVYNIKSLRVIDASIMPIIPRGNTNAPTIMIAEKASDIIKQDWNVI